MNMKSTLTPLALLLGATFAQAQTLGAWNNVGDVLANGGTIQMSTAYDASETPGPLSGHGAQDISVLEPAAGVAAYGLDLFGPAYEGSLIQQSFTVLAGQSLSFDWSFATLDGDFHDAAFVVLNGQATALNAATGASSGHFSTVFGSGGTVNLAIGVTDIGDYYGTSTLTLSNVTLTTAVPEPATYAMLLGGLAVVGFGALRRRVSP